MEKVEREATDRGKPKRKERLKAIFLIKNEKRRPQGGHKSKPNALGSIWRGRARKRADDVLFARRNKRTSEQSGLCSDVEGAAKIDIEYRATAAPDRPSGRRRICAARALCRRQNLGAGGIHFRRAFESPKGGGRLRLPEPKEKGLPDRKPFLFGCGGRT